MLEFDELKWVSVFAVLFGLIHVIFLWWAKAHFELHAGIPPYGDKSWSILPTWKDFPAIWCIWTMAAFIAGAGYLWSNEFLDERQSLYLVLIPVMVIFLDARLLVNRLPRMKWKEQYSLVNLAFFTFEALLQSIFLLQIIQGVIMHADVTLRVLFSVVCVISIGISEELNLSRWDYIKHKPYRGMS